MLFSTFSFLVFCKILGLSFVGSYLMCAMLQQLGVRFRR